MDAETAKWHPEVKLVRRAPDPEGLNGLATARDTLHHGWNGGYSAIGLAVHLGATHIILLGYDMQMSSDYRYHWHPDHPKFVPPPFTDWLLHFDSLVDPLARAGVRVTNCSRSTALRTFPCKPLLEALPCQT
jgi:hypothetical protein